MRKKVLLSAFACDPTMGSEDSYGWNWAARLAEKGFEVHCITRETSRNGIATEELPQNLTFSYVSLPPRMEKLYSASQFSLYIYYILWQWKAYKLAASLHKFDKFDIAHHVTFGSLQLGSFLYKLGIPLVFGPAGGGQMAPAAFKEYFRDAWSAEETRRRASRLLLQFNPACKTMLRKAAIVLAANEETLSVVQSHGAKNACLELDVGVSESFFPEGRAIKVPQQGRLRLLWVGRLMPRKGVLLLLDVMRELKDYPGITLNVVGDGPMRDAFLDTRKKYALEDNVLWSGRVPYSEVRNYYESHDAFLFTSLRESGGLQLVEAMAFGMPVVTLDMQGPGLIVDSDRGQKCACSTPAIAIENLKAAIIQLYNNPALIERLSAGALEFAANQRWDKKIDSVVDRFYR